MIHTDTTVAAHLGVAVTDRCTDSLTMLHSRLLLLLLSLSAAKAFHPSSLARRPTAVTRIAPLFLSDEPEASSTAAVDEEQDPMEAAMTEEERKMLEKIKRADELRAQEVFMKKSTGVHRCGNCDWEYNEAKGDVMMIGGTVQPGTAFADLPSNWRCPVCRASKDSFAEVVEEIPGFEVNQGYGFGTNSWTAGQKNLAVFGGLGFFFVLFLSGYAMS